MHTQIVRNGIDIIGVSEFIPQVFEVQVVQIKRIGSQFVAMFKAVRYLVNITEHGRIPCLAILLSTTQKMHQYLS
jgi:hypothetical protein